MLDDICSRFDSFRWVECQLKSLQSCPRSEDYLIKVLHSLPESLDETYERMLCNVDKILVEDAQRILTLLCFAVRPLKVRELIDGIAVEIHGSKGLNRKRRLQDADDILRICPGLIEIGQDATQAEKTYEKEEYTPTVRIAHYSVQEYLRSERIRQQKAANFSVNGDEANAEIAQICLTYLFEHDLSYSILNQNLLEEFPLARFAAQYWHLHYQGSAEYAPDLDDLVLKLFQSRQTFATSVKLYDADLYDPTAMTLSRRSDDIASPIYYASLLGLDRILLALTESNQKGSVASAHSILSPSTMSQDVNAQGGYHGNALQAASFKGHLKVVQLLLDQGAEVNAQGGDNGNALQAALDGGHQKIVQMLLDRGADIHVQGGFLGNALQAASSSGAQMAVQILLDRGADINVQGGYFSNALQAASYGGHQKVIQILLNGGAEINAQGGYESNALQAASSQGHERVVQMLLNYGAATDLKDVQGRHAFHLVSAKTKVNIVKLVASFTQDCKVVDKQGRNGLHHAASGGSTEVVEWLLKEGFCPNDADRDGWTPLHWAAKNGSVETSNVLKDAGAHRTTEKINGWTPEMVATFHHNQFPSILRKDVDDQHTISELTLRDSLDHLSASRSFANEGKYHEVTCDGCKLVSWSQ